VSALVVLTGAALCCGLRRGRDEQQLIVRDGGGFRRWEQPSSFESGLRQRSIAADRTVLTVDSICTKYGRIYVICCHLYV
jgi:hypothetical protein